MQGVAINRTGTRRPLLARAESSISRHHVDCRGTARAADLSYALAEGRRRLTAVRRFIADCATSTPLPSTSQLIKAGSGTRLASASACHRRRSSDPFRRANGISYDVVGHKSLSITERVDAIAAERPRVIRDPCTSVSFNLVTANWQRLESIALAQFWDVVDEAHINPHDNDNNGYNSPLPQNQSPCSVRCAFRNIVFQEPG